MRFEKEKRREEEEGREGNEFDELELVLLFLPSTLRIQAKRDEMYSQSTNSNSLKIDFFPPSFFSETRGRTASCPVEVR